MTRDELRRRIADHYASINCADPAGWCHDLRTGMTTWTPCMYGLLGLPQGDGHPPKGFGLALYTPESRERLEAAVRAAMEHDGGRFDIDLSIRHAERGYIAVRVAGSVSFVNGVPAFMDGTMAAISQARLFAIR